MKKIIFLIFLISLVSFSSELNIKLGGGSAYTENIYDVKDSSDNISIVPYIEINYKDFYFVPFELGYNFFERDNFKMRTFLNYNLAGYKSKDLKGDLKKMDDRKDDLHLGIGAEYTIKPIGVNLDVFVSGDVIGKSKGILSGLEISRPFILKDRFSIVPFISGEYKSGKYVNYYYGVTEKEAKKIGKIDSYKPKGSYELSSGVKVGVKVTEKIDALVSGSYNHYGKEIKNSPLVTKDHGYTTAIGVVYNFDF